MFTFSIFGLQEYEEIAVTLGLDHKKRRNLQAQLKSVRGTCPLFDTRQWVSGCLVISVMGSMCDSGSERVALRQWGWVLPELLQWVPEHDVGA